MSAFTPQAKLPPEQQAIRAKCFHPTGNFIEFNKEEVDQSIPARFDKIVAELPDHLAIKTQNEALTYQELTKAANRLAHAILEKLNSRSEPVILLCNHGLASITSCLAILKAGKILIAMDPTSPVERIAQVFENSQAAALLTDNANRSSAMASTKTAHQVINVASISSTRKPRLARLLFQSGILSKAKRYSYSTKTADKSDPMRSVRLQSEAAIYQANTGGNQILPVASFVTIRAVEIGGFT